MFEVGAVLAGKYRVDRILGRGGMGVVVAVTHLSLQQQVALKVLLPDLVGNRDIVERFVREARSAAQLRGEHVCRVSDVDTLPDGTPYIVMELLQGRDLSKVIKAGPLSVQAAADFALQTCVGVAEAHALGIVHRDLKPANLFLTSRPDGTPLVKVLDFGIAKAQREGQDFSLTSTATVLGSPGYMSPEQLRSTRTVDARSDVWSMGVILYELVTTRMPFHAASITELALRIAMDPAPRLGNTIPPAFEAVVMRCLGKEPEHRYQDLAQLAQALVPFGGPGAAELALAVGRLLQPRRPVQAASDVPVTVVQTAYQTGYQTDDSAPHTRYTGAVLPLPSSPPTTMRSAASSMEGVAPGSGRRWGVIAGVAAVAILLGIGTAVMLSGGEGEPRAAAPPTTTPAPATAPVEPPAPPPEEAPPVIERPPVEPAESIDAGVAEVPADAGPTQAASSTTEPTTKPPAGKRPGKKPTTKRPGSGSKIEEELLDSRF